MRLLALTIITAITAAFLFSTSAEARPHHRGYSTHHVQKYKKHRQHHYARYRYHRSARYYNNARPARWCGWQMRQWFGGGPEYNLARNWARFGSPARGPAVGVIVVWPRHVGVITARGERGWVVKSGNDSNRVRERERSLRGVFAYRWPHQHYAMR